MTRGIDNWSEAVGGPDLRILDGIASWCGGLHGSMTLSEALEAVATGFGASAAAISRHHKNEPRGRVVATFDASQDRDIPDLRRAFCQDVMGSYYDRADVGSVWFLHEREDDPDWGETQTLNNWRYVREVEDIVVIALSGAQQQRDFIEFHFTRTLGRSDVVEFETIAPTILRSWAGRMPGLVTQSQMDDRMLRARANAEASKLKWNAPILSMSNPARLSRAEFRVCLLLSRGLSVKGIIDELGLTDSTVRSHLRSIYSKTETSGQAELLYRMLSSEAEAQEASRFLSR